MNFFAFPLRGILVASLVVPMISPAFAATTIDSALLLPPKTMAPNFALQQFSSCTDMRDKVSDFMKLYYLKHPPYNWGRGVMYDKALPEMMMNQAPTAGVKVPSGMVESSKSVDTTAPSDDFSTTNSRTVGIDEPEKVKTNGKYLFTARIEDKAIYINKADDSLELLTKILLPTEYTSAELFIEGNKMVVISGKYYWNESFSNAWINRSNKAIVIVYDISNIQKPLIERYSQIDGYVSEARLVKGKLTLMTSTNFTFPIDRYMPKAYGATLELDSKKIAGDFNIKNILPKRIEFRSPKVSGNIDSSISEARNKKRLIEKDAANCQNITYVLPNADTLDSFSFNPSFTTITKIDVQNSWKTATTSMMFGDVGKAYLSASGKLYITSSLYTNGNNSCPPGMYCMMRWIEPGSQTIIHQFDASGARVKYLRTGLVPGSLISDYAIDENAVGEIRLVTQLAGNTRESQLSILDSKFGKISELTGIGKNENFKSSRFIGNRLYLVTFQQIDPLFVIDLTDSKNPKVLGELKIPGYSTYLHPYDDNRLIGIGYDTVTNQWGGTQNGGIKVDLYNVADVAKPIQEATLTLGTAGSYTEALNNPRLFVWQKSKNTLYMPVQLNSTADVKNPYNYSDVFQGLVSVKIDAMASENKIKEVARVSHIEWDEAALLKQRATDCEPYRPKEKTCRKLTTGEEVCTNGSSSYVPEYCYADSGIGTYKAQMIWQKNDQFIDRVMYSGNRTFTFSRFEIRSYDNVDGLAKKGSVVLGQKSDTPVPIMPYR